MRLHHYAGCCGPRAYYGRFGGRRGFMGRFGGFMAPGWRMARMLASGDLQLIILALLTEKSRHGYEIIRAIEEHSSGIYTPRPGVVYPALTYLEEMGYASSEQEGTKKLYPYLARSMRGRSRRISLPIVPGFMRRGGGRPPCAIPAIPSAARASD